jgi:hypothetical protein
MSTSSPDVLVVGAGPVRLTITRGTVYTLLVYLGQSITPELAAELEHLAETLRVQPGPACHITAITAASSKLPTLIGVPIIVDTAGQFAATYKPTAATAYLIRSDGYIGYHGRPITQQGIIDYLAALS